MQRIVQKYGGTSVGSPERIRAVAARVARTRRTGADLVVVVSAMGHTTDQLIELAREVHPAPPQRELDMLLTAGERISMALLAMALEREGVEALSFTGSQSGIITTDSHGQAKILEVRGDRIRKELARGRVVIVAGFQGVSQTREITTLGRGGSDTTAVALAGCLGADCCEICTDVLGVMSADPRTVPDARVLRHLDYPCAIRLTALGAGVLVPRAASLGYTLRVPIVVCSSSEEDPGTRIDMEAMVESQDPLAVTRAQDVAWLEFEAGSAPRIPSGASLLAYAEGPGGGPTRAAVHAPQGVSLELEASLVRARGELVSLVLPSVVQFPTTQEAARIAREAGVSTLAVLAGPGYLSHLVPDGQGEILVREWHRHWIAKRPARV